MQTGSNYPLPGGARKSGLARRLQRSSSRRQAGWTLLEALVAMSIASLFLLALYGFYRFNIQTLSAETARLSVRESSRLAVDFLVRELRMAGARPVRDGACDGFERLLVAEAQAIAFQYDFRGDRINWPADGCPDDPSERVRYSYDAQAQMLRRATGKGSAQPFIGNIPADGFRLSYFDRAGAQLLPPLDADERAAVFLIELTVRTAQPHPDPQGGKPIAASLSSAIFLPNPPN